MAEGQPGRHPGDHEFKQVESCFLNHNSSIHCCCTDSLLMTHHGGLSLSIIIWRIGGRVQVSFCPGTQQFSWRPWVGVTVVHFFNFLFCVFLCSICLRFCACISRLPLQFSITYILERYIFCRIFNTNMEYERY